MAGSVLARVVASCWNAPLYEMLHCTSNQGSRSRQAWRRQIKELWQSEPDLLISKRFQVWPSLVASQKWIKAPDSTTHYGRQVYNDSILDLTAA